MQASPPPGEGGLQLKSLFNAEDVTALHSAI